MHSMTPALFCPNDEEYPRREVCLVFYFLFILSNLKYWIGLFADVLFVETQTIYLSENSLRYLESKRNGYRKNQ